MARMVRSRLSLGIIIVAVLAACEGPPEPQPAEDGMQSVDGGGDRPPGCARCGEGEVCMDGACVALPRSCPCPKESYCNLATNTCVAGCTDDSHCSTGRICQAQSRQCRTGCRSDGACGKGQICESELCRAGCRRDPDCGSGEICDPGRLVCKAGCMSDAACGMGQICEQLRCKVGCRMDDGCGAGQICVSMNCRSGCRKDADCGMNAVCKRSSLTCIACGADPDEAMDSTVSTSGRSVSERITRVLCGAADVDRVTWRQGPPNPGYYRRSTWVTVSGASPMAVTTFKLSLEGTTETHQVVGNGMKTLRQDTYDYYCFMGQCAGWTHTVEASSDSETPVKIEFGFNVSATR